MEWREVEGSGGRDGGRDGVEGGMERGREEVEGRSVLPWPQ